MAGQEHCRLAGATYRRCQWRDPASAASVAAMGSWNTDSDGRPRSGGANPPRGAGEPPAEHILLPIVHKHWMMIARELAIPAAVSLPLLLLALAFGSGLAATMVLAGFGLAAVWAWLHWAWATVTVTDERVIIKRGVVVRTTQVIPLDRVQDVSTRQNLLGQLLGYGSLVIDTAGQEMNQVIDYLPAPGQLREQVFELSDRFWRGPDLGEP